MSNEAQIDPGAPDRLAVLRLVQLAFAVEPGKGLRRQRSLPVTGISRDSDLELFGQSREIGSAIVVRGSDEGDTAIAVAIRPALGRGKVNRGLIGGLNLDHIA